MRRALPGLSPSSTDREVTARCCSPFPATLSLALGACVIFLTVGVAHGIYGSPTAGPRLDRRWWGSRLVIGSIPYYIVALLVALYLIDLQRASYPAARTTRYSPRVPPPGSAGLLAPWLVLGLVNSTSYTRYSRGSMVETLNEDYVRTARAKGISRAAGHLPATRCAPRLSPVVTIFGLDVAGLLAGDDFTERIFDIDGHRPTWCWTALNNNDLPVIMGTVLVAAIAGRAANLVVDIVYSFIDPRVRLT